MTRNDPQSDPSASPSDNDLPSYDDVLAARRRIAPHVHRTPVLTSSHIDETVGAQLFFKCENLQKVGAFKARGAVNAVFGLPDVALAAGVVTHSSGNHGAALAYAAARRGIPCHVVMPSTAPEAKKAAVRGYGATITQCAPSTTARERALAHLQAESGAHMVHPFNDPLVIAGQGTCAAELVDDIAGLDAIVAPIGGGGLISGTCLVAGAVDEAIEVHGAEPSQADDAYRSLKAGRLITDDAPTTIADGLKASLKDRTWSIISRQVTRICTVSEAEIIDAMRLVWSRMKIIIEPSCAVAVAAVIKDRRRFAGKRVGVILTGGNVDLDLLPWQT